MQHLGTRGLSQNFDMPVILLSISTVFLGIDFDGSQDFSLKFCPKNIYTTTTRWWQLKYFWNFHSYLGKMNPFWRSYFSDGLKPPTRQASATKIFRWELSRRLWVCLSCGSGGMVPWLGRDTVQWVDVLRDATRKKDGSLLGVWWYIYIYIFREWSVLGGVTIYKYICIYIYIYIYVYVLIYYIEIYRCLLFSYTIFFYDLKQSRWWYEWIDTLIVILESCLIWTVGIADLDTELKTGPANRCTTLWTYSSPIATMA